MLSIDQIEPALPYLQALALLFVAFIAGRIVTVLTNKAASAQLADHVLISLALKAISAPLRWSLVIVAVYISYDILPTDSLPKEWDQFLDLALKSGLIGFISWTGWQIFESGMDLWELKAERSETRLDDQLVPIVRRTGRTFLILISLLLVLQNLGFSIGGLLAGFGIGSAAIALAAKETLSNVLGSLVIFFDRPFMIGDWIEMGAVEGTVEEVGIRTTRIRTFANAQITVPNASFTTQPITNWSRMHKRRIKFSFELTYDTKSAQAQQVVEGVRNLIRGSDTFDQDLFLVNLSSLAASGWEISVYCFTTTTVWQEFLDAREQFLFDIWALLEDVGAELAYPSQTIYTQKLEA